METDFNYIDCIEKVKQHDDSASEALYRFTFPIAQKQVVLFVHNRQDQEDLLQTIFIKIFEQLHTLKEPEKYPGWAKMIARNTCMDYGRHLKLENNLIQWKTTVSDEEEEGMDQLAVPTYSREFNPEAHIDAETTKELIDQILEGLSDKQRMVILLWMQQYKESEIAKELDMPIGSVRTNCRRGKAAIEKKVIELEKQGTKLYSMSPIVFFLWLLDQYDMLYVPAFTDAACMPLYHKIKLHIQKPDINSETVHQLQNAIMDTGSNTSNAASSMKFPILIAQITGAKQNAVLKLLNSGYWFNTSKPWYTFGALIYLVLIFAFSYFYTEITMNPEEIANNIKKSGGNIAGIRAGSSTAEYLRKQMKYLIAIGSFCLCIIAIIPFIVSGLTSLSRLSFFGTSIIITVSVILETKKLILSKTQENYYMNRVKKGGLFRG